MVERFSPAGSMTARRDVQTATLLANGMVLIAGGYDEVPLASAELYDPKTGKFSSTGSMAYPRSQHTATLLPDGRVLVAGGSNSSPPDPAELYDPATGKFSPTGRMTAQLDRFSHTATLLPDGRVLLAGGRSDASAELYDPKTGTFSPTGRMETDRSYATATLLPDGRVLVAGGQVYDLHSIARSLNSAELYDPATGKFSPTGSMAATRARDNATLLSSGRVLIAGGAGGTHGENIALASAELYDPKTGAFSPAGSMSGARYYATATTLSDGRVLLAGGATASADLYDPGTGTFRPTGSMSVLRATHTATLLPDGRVLVAGGSGGPPGASSSETLASAELYTP
jgi:WD40 repeat protein